MSNLVCHQQRSVASVDALLAKEGHIDGTGIVVVPGNVLDAGRQQSPGRGVLDKVLPCQFPTEHS
jgi:hypothetical protein